MNYYIQGSADRAEEIKVAFEKLGCDTTGWKFNVEGGFYYTHDGRIDLACGNFLINLIKTHPDYKELELPVEPHYDIRNFYVGMPVLVRPDNDCCWDYSVFSRINSNEYWPFSVCNGVSFTQCIPFEGNEHLLGTTDPCDEQYINW